MTRRVPPAVRWVGVIAVAGAILYASVVRPPDGGLSAFGPFGLLRVDKYLHALAYAGLAVALAYALAPTRLAEPTVLAVTFLLAAGYGFGIELVQTALPVRQFDVADLAANAAGTALAVALWRAGARLRAARRAPT